MTIITAKTAAQHLDGEAMPGIIERFAKLCEGKMIIQAGYVIEKDVLNGKQAVPVLLLDNGRVIYAMADDEGNGPGCLVAEDAMLCETTPK